MKADKPKVVDEVWDEARIRSFLYRAAPADGTSSDYNILLRAYQGMRPGDFALFIAAFVAEGHDLNATDARGQSIAAFVARHRHGQEFLAILEAAGAKRTAMRSRQAAPSQARTDAAPAPGSNVTSEASSG